MLISIHAPQWGATQAIEVANQETGISIHAPQWGATGRWPPSCLPPSYFNPRTPVGCDQGGQVAFADSIISIHAPQWGATHRRIRITRPDSQFQSTHPSGVRLLVRPVCGLLTVDFNPRTPVGCDLRAELLALIHEMISIHAPQWGATGLRRRGVRQYSFQSTHPSGVRQRFATFFDNKIIISIHAPQWGATNGEHNGLT